MKKVLTLVALGALFISHAAIVSAEGGGFSISPTRGTSSRLIYQIKPGESMTDTVRITNYEAVEKTFSIFAVDKNKAGSNVKSESFVLKGKTDVQEDIGLWTKLSMDQVTLKGGESKNIEFTLNMPSSTPKEVTYEGGIVFVEIPNADIKTASGSKAITTQVNIMSQVAVRLYVTATDNPQLTETTQGLKVEASKDAGADVANPSSNMPMIVLGLLTLTGIGFIISRKRK